MPGYIEIARSVRRLKEAGAQAGVIGKSVRGKDIFFVAVGVEKKAAGGIIVTAAIHAREHVTAHAAIVQAKDFCGIIVCLRRPCILFRS